ncbi:hypothetical protein U9M48_021155 [Paspalum notatum var. saurae]|uniref:Uncharacterized protein n=1 Tax=Paspalum notatum var. saurae TaxID=547442 RepID=A0AAQ3WTL2_PASNO
MMSNAFRLDRRRLLPPSPPLRASSCSSEGADPHDFILAAGFLLEALSSSPASERGVSGSSAGGEVDAPSSMASSRSKQVKERSSSTRKEKRRNPILNQSLSMISSAVARRCGLVTRTRRRRRVRSGENHLGQRNSPLWILRYMATRLRSWKGRKPATRTKSTTPQDQRSALAASYPRRASTSGATYAGVPQKPVVPHLVGHGREPEVGHLEVAGVVHQQVLGLDVAVVHAARVAEGDGGHQLLEVAPRVGFPEAAAVGDAREELAAAHVLHHEVDAQLGGHHLEELHDVRVADTTEHGDLALDVRRQTRLEDLLLLHHLDGHLLAGKHVARVVHLGEVALTQQLPHLVTPQKERRLLLVAVGLFPAAAAAIAADSLACHPHH